MRQPQESRWIEETRPALPEILELTKSQHQEISQAWQDYHRLCERLGAATAAQAEEISAV